MAPIIKWRERDVMPSFSKMVENFFRDDDFYNNFWTREHRMPLVNVKDTDKSFLLDVAAPGMKKEDFILQVKENVLIISAEKEEKKEEKDDDFTRKEFSYSSFSRSFWLPENVREEAISAEYKDGVLHIDVPKSEVTKAEPVKKIKIS